MADTKRQLSELRQRIARIDLELLSTLEARARVSREIHAVLEGEPPGLDAPEQEWFAPLAEASGHVWPASSLLAIYRQIRAEARALEQPVKVAYFGPEGGLGHTTAQGYFGSSALAIPCVTVAEALTEVERGRAGHAVFPFESSSDGLIHSSITALAATELVIVDERTISATYDVFSAASALDRITTVYVTTTARAACEGFLGRELGKAQVVTAPGPRDAFERAVQDPTSAAIVPSPWHHERPLQVLRANVGDQPDLRLRFAVAGSRPAMRSGNDTTALLFSVDDSPGSLYEVLRHFSERGVNLRKLHSRPVQQEALFYVEALGHVTDRPVTTALEAVKRSTRYFRLIGSFPARS